MSDATATLVACDLPDELVLTDLGVVRLRDLARPERVWQLDVAGLPCSFPTLRSLEAPANNVPVALSSLVGRDRELAEICELLGGHRLVTLSGAGGVGKTRLAQQAAVDLLERHGGGTWWVELAPLASAPQVAERLAEVLGLGPSVVGDVAAAAVRLLRSAGSTLVVLDNAEHVVDAVAELALRLLEGCPELRLLVTSREPLGVPGEMVWRVPSLSTPPSDVSVEVVDLSQYGAAQLFVERAHDARPSLVLDAQAAAAVVSICARLDGIPLAIELAAARARSMPLDRLATGLDDAFRLLTGGARTALARQQTLLASIGWSVDLLDDRDDAVLCRLAVFAGSFSLDAAEVVAGDGDLVEAFDVVDSLGRLVDKSLVQFDDVTGRCRLLETVRQFGRDRLRQRGELASARTRHAEWCAGWAEEVAALRHGIDAKPFLAMVPDLVAALDWTMTGAPEVALRICAGFGPFLGVLGPSTSLRLCDWIVATDPTTVEPALWAAVVGGIARRAIVLERSDVWELMPQALASADPDDRRTVLYLRALEQLPAAFTGRVDGVRQVCAESIEVGDDLIIKLLAG